jgi:hypothetical protein
MSSEISTEGKANRRPMGATAGKKRGAQMAQAAPGRGTVPPPAGSGMRPWHLFVLGGLAASSAGAIAVRDTTPLNIVFTCLAILTASAAGYGLYRTLSPLLSEEAHDNPEIVGGRTRAALEREKFLALRAIKDLEFDRAMGKVSEADCQEIITRLRARAVRLIRQLDTGAAGYRELIEREVSARLGVLAPAPSSVPSPAPAPPPIVVSRSSGLCARCQTENDIDARFCKRCGAKLASTLLVHQEPPALINEETPERIVVPNHAGVILIAGIGAWFVGIAGIYALGRGVEDLRLIGQQKMVSSRRTLIIAGMLSGVLGFLVNAGLLISFCVSGK